MHFSIECDGERFVSLKKFSDTFCAFHCPGLLCMELKRIPQFKYIVVSEYFSVCVSTKVTM